MPAARQLGETPPRVADPKVLAPEVYISAAGRLGLAPQGMAVPNVPGAQVNVPAAGQLRQAPPDSTVPNVPAAQVNLHAARQLGQPPLCVAGPYLLAAQVNVIAAGQLGQAPPGNVPAAGRIYLCNLVMILRTHKWDVIPAHPIMILCTYKWYVIQVQQIMILCTHKWYAIHVHWIMTLHWRKCYLIHHIMAQQWSKTNLFPQAFALHPTVGPQGSHCPNHQLVSSFYLVTYEMQIGALCLGVRPWVWFMPCSHEVVWHYPSLKGIKSMSPQIITYTIGVPLISIA